MGRKSSAKANMPPPQPPAAPNRSLTPLVAIVAVTAIAIGAFAYMRNTGSDEIAQAAAASNAAPPPAPEAPAPPPQDLKPHPQANLPALQFPGYPMARPPEVVRAAYKFAAEHPEIATYVPCFCGCERAGHRGNEDCFVHARDVNGDVVEWTDHGMECAVCLDVATKSAQMYASGASVRDIRAAIENEWAARSPNHTPTPEPPAK